MKENPHTSAPPQPVPEVVGDATRAALRMLRALRPIIRAVDVSSHRLAGQHNITGPQLDCLLTLRELGPLTSAVLARRLYLSPSTVVGIVDRLEEKGLLQRERDRRDRRQVYLSLTAAGTQLTAQAPTVLQDRLAQALAALPLEERQNLTLALERLALLFQPESLTALTHLQPAAAVAPAAAGAQGSSNLTD
ncbi:MAG: MarR family transcriptional regulator [Desulfuromonas thiophila]|jgi:DNA-binding MarR family transcriptional regulator|nr:MarR family transcriptional regulator [Desulfuromonas thiophila]MDD3800640.1 MarR family transcriptional regulator [Desulfuromonas thiophila]MDY0398939.1 MarR family transcriptional regulator [Desulfuromonas thiophila]